MVDYDTKTVTVVLAALAGLWFLFGREDRNADRRDYSPGGGGGGRFRVM